MMEIENAEQTIKNLIEDLKGYKHYECEILFTKAIERIEKEKQKTRRSW